MEKTTAAMEDIDQKNKKRKLNRVGEQFTEGLRDRSERTYLRVLTPACLPGRRSAPPLSSGAPVRSAVCGRGKGGALFGGSVGGEGR